MVDYSIYYKDLLKPDVNWAPLSWDLLISAFNSSERVQTVFGKVSASEKHWLIQPEYNYQPGDYPSNGRVFASTALNEADFVLEYISNSGVDLRAANLCVDITGFMRPHLLFLLYYLYVLGVKKFQVLYSEPGHYSKKERTTFSEGPVTQVRQVAGYEGLHVPDSSDDVLVLGSGYDADLMKAIAEDKEHARRLQILGFPSLRPEMYQENILRAASVAEAIGRGPGNSPGNYFAPASDPFITAAVLSRVIARERAVRGITNLYLCPTGTKSQALGFGIYFLNEWQAQPCSLIFPFREGYDKETTKGISRVWKYVIEF
jgi:hypothetical protein